MSSKNWGIGKDNQLLAHIPSDLKHFQSITKYSVVIMGRKTLESLPNGEPLKNRTNIVLTRDLNYRKKDVIVMHSIKHLVAYMWLIETLTDTDCYVIGGGEIYKELLPNIDKIYVTKIDGKFKADTYFPNLDKSNEWEITDESEIHNENGFNFKYVTYERVV